MKLSLPCWKRPRNRSNVNMWSLYSRAIVPIGTTSFAPSCSSVSRCCRRHRRMCHPNWQPATFACCITSSSRPPAKPRNPLYLSKNMVFLTYNYYSYERSSSLLDIAPRKIKSIRNNNLSKTIGLAYSFYFNLLNRNCYIISDDLRPILSVCSKNICSHRSDTCTNDTHALSLKIVIISLKHFCIFKIGKLSVIST